MEIMHERVAGLDVHKAMIVACVRLMSGGKVERECRTFETTTSGLLDLLAWLTASDCTHVAMEATGVYWKPVWNILSDGVFELILANAAHIKNVPGRKTDVNDATWIADLTACGLIKASFVPEQQIQELRSMLRARKQKAICAVAASMLTAIYHMLKDGVEHHDLGAHHFDRRSTDAKAKRLVAQLTKLGFQVELQPLKEAA